MLHLSDVQAQLDRIDWNFPGSGTATSSIHSLHPFPGNFIAQIPRFLIQILSEPGNTVLDPFGGSGTTAVEAISLGRPAITGDYLTGSIFLAKAKIAAFLHPISKSIQSDLLARLTWDHLCETEAVGANGEGSNPELHSWYAARTMAQLRYLWGLIEQFDGTTRQILEIVFSDLLYACASTLRSKTATGKIRRHHWGWIADNVHPKELPEHNAVEGFRERLKGLISRPDQAQQHLILQQDARSLAIASNSIDLIVTSPPYVGMIDYVRANRMLYLWMNWPFDRDRRQEIGARYRRGGSRFVDDYLRDMQLARQEIARVLRPHGYCAIVLGESRKFPGTVDKVLADVAQALDLVWGPVFRTPSRRRVSDRFAQQAVEQIVVFRKK